MTTSKESSQTEFGYSPDYRKAYDIAKYISGIDNTNIGIQQLTLGVMSRLGLNNIEGILGKYNIMLNVFLQDLSALETSRTDSPKLEPNQKPNVNPQAIEAIRLSITLARNEGSVSVKPKHLLIGIRKYLDQHKSQDIKKRNEII
jgi:hypothetical protein